MVEGYKNILYDIINAELRMRLILEIYYSERISWQLFNTIIYVIDEVVAFVFFYAPTSLPRSQSYYLFKISKICFCSVKVA